MTNSADIADKNNDRLALHNIIVLAIAQSFNYALAPLSMAIGGLAGSYLLDEDKTFATLPVTFFILGPLFGAFPAALLMKKIGRRNGFLIGSFFGFCGCASSAYSILHASFAQFCFSLFLIGVSISFAQQYRFAAADFGSSEVRTRGLSWVMGGGLLAAVIGPQTALYFNDFFPAVVFAGSFVGGMILSCVGFFILLLMKKPPLEVVEERVSQKPTRPLFQIIKQPLFLTSLVCGSVSYMSMSLVMTAAPLAMILCGFDSSQSTTAIQFHIMAMFAPSFFTGSLIIRFGHARIISAALGLFLICAGVALSGIELEKFWVSLVLLGIAWNFGYIGATSMVTKTYEPHEKNKVQGVFDSIVFGSAALMSLMSGVLLNTVGWNVVLTVVIPLVAICGLILWLQRVHITSLETA